MSKWRREEVVHVLGNPRHSLSCVCTKCEQIIGREVPRRLQEALLQLERRDRQAEGHPVYREDCATPSPLPCVPTARQKGRVFLVVDEKKRKKREEKEKKERLSEGQDGQGGSGTVSFLSPPTPAAFLNLKS